jgi:hypothetical protein
MRGSYGTLYLRHEFGVEDAANVAALLLELDYDDAFIGYVNGIEVTRSNKAGSNEPVAHDDRADGPRSQEGQVQTFIDLGPFPGLLREGEDNVLAIQGVNGRVSDGVFVLSQIQLSAVLTGTSSVRGDFDADGILTSNDVDLLSSEVASAGGNAAFDLNADGLIDSTDVDALLMLAHRLNGDADFDGQVRFADFVVLANNFGEAGKKWSEGNFDSQGGVEFPDFTILANNFEQVAVAAAETIPEPSTGILTFSLVILLVKRRLRSPTKHRSTRRDVFTAQISAAAERPPMSRRFR